MKYGCGSDFRRFVLIRSLKVELACTEARVAVERRNRVCNVMEIPKVKA